MSLIVRNVTKDGVFYTTITVLTLPISRKWSPQLLQFLRLPCLETYSDPLSQSLFLAAKHSCAEARDILLAYVG